MIKISVGEIANFIEAAHDLAKAKLRMVGQGKATTAKEADDENTFAVAVARVVEMASKFEQAEISLRG